MYPHHAQTIAQLHRRFAADPANLALIVVGSVARDDAREDSDVGFFVVVSDATHELLNAQDACGIDASDCSVAPCREANGTFTSIAAFRRVREAGSEIDRYTFTSACIPFSRDADLATLLTDIPRYPDARRQRRMESYYSQIHHHLSFLEFAVYSQTKYLIYETATRLILAVGRLILADNRMLYPSRKWFFRELQKATDKPDGLCEAMLALLDRPSIEAAHRIPELLGRYKAYPVPAEGMKARIVRETLLNLEAW